MKTKMHFSREEKVRTSDGVIAACSFLETVTSPITVWVSQRVRKNLHFPHSFRTKKNLLVLGSFHRHFVFRTEGRAIFAVIL